MTLTAVPNLSYVLALLKKHGDAAHDAELVGIIGLVYALVEEAWSLRAAQTFSDDVQALLEALGISIHARPISPHQVVIQEVLPAIRNLRASVVTASSKETPRFDVSRWAWIAEQVAKQSGRVEFCVTESGDVGVFVGREEKCRGSGNTPDDAVDCAMRSVSRASTEDLSNG